MRPPHRTAAPSSAAIDDPRRTPVDSLAVIRPNRLSRNPRTDCLSPHEHDRWRQIRNAERQSRWLAGRLLLKYLFLERLSEGDQERLPRPLQDIGCDELDTFPRWLYREIEIASERGTARRGPALMWGGAPSGVNVSLTHTRDFTAACLHATRAVGLDAEIPCTRLGAFYRVNFSPAERNWAGRMARCGGLDRDSLYTILWCMKEAALKSRHAPDSSLWGLPRIRIGMPDDVELLQRALRSGAEGPTMGVFDTRLNEAGRSATATCGLTVWQGTVLVVITR